jgi:glycosyltransferase involved in cell wall biosynthesis
MIGDGPARSELESRHREIVFAGMRTGEDLARHYASGDVFLFASTTETFGNVVTEAMSSGLVVLAFDYAAAREHLRTGLNGWTVPLGGEEDFVSAGAAILSMRSHWRAFRRAARETALELTWDRVVAEFEAELERVRDGAPGETS